MSGAWQSRMQWELKQLSNSPPPGVVAWPADGASLSHLEAQIEGPQDTVYEGGVFRLDIQIPERRVYIRMRCFEVQNVQFRKFSCRCCGARHSRASCVMSRFL